MTGIACLTQRSIEYFEGQNSSANDLGKRPSWRSLTSKSLRTYE